MITKDEAYKQVEHLVNRFAENIDSYKSIDYNETQTRRDFIDPFFKALGWDIDNSQGFAEAYREVIHEDKVKVGKATKAPDYSFRLSGGKRLFFVEAKKPSVYVKDDISVAYQVRRYGWSAKLAVSIVTDFEEFAVYDCTKKPIPTDKPLLARIKYITYDKYLSEFDYLWNTFSKEQVLKGSFDRYIQSDTIKKGTATVDKEFLASLDSWRTYLATSISIKNRELDEDEINFAVQQTIDRLIFLRIAEDRGVEPYGQLKSSVNQKGEAYENLFYNFKKADEKYNSGLFDFNKDVISDKLKVDSKVVKTIVNEMYYPESPYEFSVISVEILGSAYEQFLGKQIKVETGHRAKIEEKPEVRKAGGVFYTPQYIVDYIVKNTLGELIEGKTPKQIEKLKICDPACGSGSFLIGAYQYLLDFHKNYYTDNGTKVGKKDSPTTPEGNLTSSEKKRILLNNIYGVDIDVNAVEVTKLSLLLKCMEGETETSIAQQFKLWHDRILPTLDNNIKSGNSLVDTDFYNSVIDFGEEKKVKPFSWQKAFSEIFSNGGFDVVIGNPPYVMLQNLEIREVFDYSLRKFSSAKYKIDTYQLFTEQSIKLLKNNGLLGFITPNTFLKNIHSEPLRKFIIENAVIKEFLLFNYSVFSSASVDTCVFIFEKAKANKNSQLDVNKSDKEFVVEKVSDLNQNLFIENNRLDFNLLVSNNDTDILTKISNCSKPLSTYCGAYFGIQTFDRKTYVSIEKNNKSYEPVIDGGNIEPYYLKPSTEFVNYTPSAIKSGGNESIYRQDRICIRQIGAYPISTFVEANIFTLNTIYNVFLKQENIANLNFLLGIINSNVNKYFWKKNNSDEKKTFPKIKKEAILSIPIPVINDKSKTLHDSICNLVEQLLQLNKELQETKLDSKKQNLVTKIDYCKDRINKIVYQFYDFTEEEIKIVEGD